MKRFLSLLPVILLFVTSCDNNKAANGNAANEDSIETLSADKKQMQNAADDMEKKKEELSKLTPLTLDELKALLPKTLMGTEGTNFEANSAMGAGLANAEYALSDSTHISLNIYDCAGSAGSGIYSLQYLGMLNMQQDTDEEYTKTIDFNGSKAFEHCDKTSNDCTFTYFAGGRYLVTLSGDNVNAETLKQAARALNIR